MSQIKGLRDKLKFFYDVQLRGSLAKNLNTLKHAFLKLNVFGLLKERLKNMIIYIEN